MSEANKALIRRIFEEIFNGRQHQLVSELYCDDCIGCDPANPADIEGHEGLIALLDGYATAFPDHKYELLDLIAEGDKVVAHWRVYSPAQGAVPEIKTEGLSLCTVRGGRVHRVHQHFDNLGVLRALGAVSDDLSMANTVAKLQ